jgi:hypothetical protein
MAEAKRQVTLSKADRATAVGIQLIDLLVELSDDGNVWRDEMYRLRLWLEIDHGVDFPCLAFLQETIHQMSSDGEVTEDELDSLAPVKYAIMSDLSVIQMTLTRTPYTSSN